MAWDDELDQLLSTVTGRLGEDAVGRALNCALAKAIRQTHLNPGMSALMELVPAERIETGSTAFVSSHLLATHLKRELRRLLRAH